MVTGGLASGLINDVWQGIRFYQSLAYGNERGIERFLNDQDAFSTGEYQFSPGQFLYTLRTPEAHGLFLDEAFGKAQSRVILFSPFIRLTKLQEVFSNTRLSALQQKGVQVKLVTLPSPCSVPEEQRKIFSTLKSLCTGYPNFSYLTLSNFHAKTLFADNDLICEGSLNWLSAVTGIDHEANNFEMSVAIRGNIAREMIQKFEGTTFAQPIIQKPRQPIQAPVLKRDPPVASYTKQPSFQKPKRPQPQEDPSIQQPPFKKLKAGPVNFPPSFNNAIKIFSGDRFGIDGYCVRFNNGDYLKNRGDILYFETPEDAKQAAYAIWKK